MLGVLTFSGFIVKTIKQLNILNILRFIVFYGIILKLLTLNVEIVKKYSVKPNKFIYTVFYKITIFEKYIIITQNYYKNYTYSFA